MKKSIMARCKAICSKCSNKNFCGMGKLGDDDITPNCSVCANVNVHRKESPCSECRGIKEVCECNFELRWQQMRFKATYEVTNVQTGERIQYTSPWIEPKEWDVWQTNIHRNLNNIVTTLKWHDDDIVIGMVNKTWEGKTNGKGGL